MRQSLKRKPSISARLMEKTSTINNNIMMKLINGKSGLRYQSGDATGTTNAQMFEKANGSDAIKLNSI